MKQLEAWLLDSERVLNTAKPCVMLFHSSRQVCVEKTNMYNKIGKFRFSNVIAGCMNSKCLIKSCVCNGN
jgi:hypothetical protein